MFGFVFHPCVSVQCFDLSCGDKTPNVIPHATEIPWLQHLRSGAALLITYLHRVLRADLAPRLQLARAAAARQRAKEAARLVESSLLWKLMALQACVRVCVCVCVSFGVCGPLGSKSADLRPFSCVHVCLYVCVTVCVCVCVCVSQGSGHGHPQVSPITHEITAALIASADRHAHAAAPAASPAKPAGPAASARSSGGSGARKEAAWHAASAASRLHEVARGALANLCDLYQCTQELGTYVYLSEYGYR